MSKLLPHPDITVKTKYDLQTMLVILLIIFIAGIKCYMMIAGPQATSQQQTESRTTNNITAGK